MEKVTILNALNYSKITHTVKYFGHGKNLTSLVLFLFLISLFCVDTYHLDLWMIFTPRNTPLQPTDFYFFAIAKFTFLISFFFLLGLTGRSQVVINELGIASTSDGGTGGEFVELFNKSGCNVDISCNVLVYSGTTYTNAGWSVTIPSGTILTPGQYYLIGGKNSDRFFTSSWGNGVKGTIPTWINTYGTYGNDVADLDLGMAYTSGKSIIIGNQINNGGQITLVKPDGTIASSVSYNNGNTSGSYPATPNTLSGCSLGSVPNPNTTITPPNYNSTYNSYQAGLFLDASGNYQYSYKGEPGNSPTPGKANISQLSAASAPLITTHPVSQADCKGNSVVFSASYSATVPVNYQWQSSTDNGITWGNISGASGSTSISPVTYTANNIAVSGANINLTQYRVIITDAYGCLVTSNSAVLTVNEITSITPGNTQTSICEGQGFSFTVTTSGNTPSSYQWKKDGSVLTDGTMNGTTITGSNSATLTVTNAKPNESGSYTVTVVYPITTPNNNGGDPATCSETSSVTRNVTVNTKPTPIIYHN